MFNINIRNIIKCYLLPSKELIENNKYKNYIELYMSFHNYNLGDYHFAKILYIKYGNIFKFTDNKWYMYNINKNIWEEDIEGNNLKKKIIIIRSILIEIRNNFNIFIIKNTLKIKITNDELNIIKDLCKRGLNEYIRNLSRIEFKNYIIRQCKELFYK